MRKVKRILGVYQLVVIVAGEEIQVVNGEASKPVIGTKAYCVQRRAQLRDAGYSDAEYVVRELVITASGSEVINEF